MHRGLTEPHLFNAGPNPFRLIKNLKGLIAEAELEKIQQEIIKNVIDLFRLGESHYLFACSIAKPEWRQRVSRYYYGAYNVKRAVSLRHSGAFSTDSSDHKTVELIPVEMNNAAALKSKLANLRDDRNIADYSHLAVESDLLISPDECEKFVKEFIDSAREYLKSQQVQV
jgi:hypothetical protein